MSLYQYWRADATRLYSAFLTIRQRGKVIRYERIHIRRLYTRNLNEYVFLPTGTSVAAPVIAVSKACKFPRDDLYTILRIHQNNKYYITRYADSMQYLCWVMIAHMHKHSLIICIIYIGVNCLSLAVSFPIHSLPHSCLVSTCMYC